MALADGGSTPKATPKKAPAKKAPANTAVPSAPSKAGYTPETFSAELLKRLGVPVSSENMNFMTSWLSAEGGNWHNSASYNPLNTSQQMPGELGTMGSQGNIRRYANWEQGLQATVKTLQNGRYGSIIDAMKRSDSAGAVSALRASPWDVNHYTDGNGNSTFPLGGGGSYAQANGATPDDQMATVSGKDGIPSNPGTPNQDVADYLSGSYGYLTAFLHDPEVGPIIQSAAKGGWSDNKMLEALSKTNWWQTTGQTARQWQSTLATDPATAKAQLATTQSHIQALASSSGINLSSDDIYHMAYAANMFGWSDLQVQQAVGSQFKYKSGSTYTGAAGTDIAQMQQIAKQYMIPVSDKALQQWTAGSLSGDKNISDFTAYAQNVAKSLYSGNKWMVGQIEAGVAPSVAVDPWKQLAAQTLDVAPDTIDFTKPQWQKAINTIDPNTGASAPMNLDQWQRTLKTDKTYGYDHTDAAMGEAASLITSIGQSFGKIG